MLAMVGMPKTCWEKKLDWIIKQKLKEKDTYDEAPSFSKASLLRSIRTSGKSRKK